MLRGESVGLRARRAEDVAVLEAELYDDVPTRSRADARPWRPIPPGSPRSRFAPEDPSDDAAIFSVVLLDGGELAGDALLWGIDTHNRSAHIGLSLRPAFRRRGLAGDTIAVLCAYGFTVRGLYRLQAETLADNEALIRAAQRAGFVVEGRLRGSAWVTGEFVDLVVLGMLADEGKVRFGDR